MKATLEALLASALATLRANGVLPADFAPAIQLDRTRDPAHGDWATNLALASAKAAGRKPREIAEALVQAHVARAAQLVLALPDWQALARAAARA